MTLFLFIVGLVFLIVGAELLVRGASRLASLVGIPPLISGLTVVAFGTSAPELAVSVKAAFTNQGGIAVGNVIGSNIFNILFILGLSALICPLTVSKQLIRFDVPLLIAVSLLTFFFAWDHQFGRIEGLILFSGLVIYTSFLIYLGIKSITNEEQKSEAVSNPVKQNPMIDVLLMVIGLILLVFGSQWLVDSTIVFAQFLGVSEEIISLTIVSAGTSLPEVVTSLVASLRGERDIAVGNVIGSNLFNLLGVLGLSALVTPIPIEVAPTVLTLDLPIMLAVAFAALPIFFTGGIISRWEGGVLFGYYIAYTTYLVLLTTNHTILPVYQASLFYFVIPLTLLTLVILIVQAVRKQSG